MDRLDGYDHRTGRHCGPLTVRNVLEYYEWEQPTTRTPSDWDFDTATTFALGQGIASVTYDDPEAPGTRFLGRSPWLETHVLETLDVQYLVSEGTAWEVAWADVTDRLDADDPVVLFLDPAALDYLGAHHRTPHAAVIVGYDDEAGLLADPAVAEPRPVSLDDLREAWDVPEPFGATNRHLVVQRDAIGVDHETAASRAVRETTGYMLDTPERDDRVWGERGDHGVEGLRAFADDVARWPDASIDAAAAAAAAHRALTTDGEGTAFRRLYAEGLTDIAPMAGLSGAVADRMHDIADEWAAVTDEFATARDAPDAERSEALEVAASTLGALAEQEASFFRDVRRELRN